MQQSSESPSLHLVFGVVLHGLNPTSQGLLASIVFGMFIVLQEFIILVYSVMNYS